MNLLLCFLSNMLFFIISKHTQFIKSKNDYLYLIRASTNKKIGSMPIFFYPQSSQ